MLTQQNGADTGPNFALPGDQPNFRSPARRRNEDDELWLTRTQDLDERLAIVPDDQSGAGQKVKKPRPDRRISEREPVARGACGRRRDETQ
jgi:hypothetical protein